MDIRDVIDKISSSKAEWIDLQFVDLLGFLRHVTVHPDKINEDSFKRGLGKLDGSSVKGFKSIEESDLVLKPIPHTLAKIPEEWVGGATLLRFLCEVYEPGGVKRLPKDPRYALERTIDYMKDHYFLKALASFELEFFVFDEFDLRVEPLTQVIDIKSSETRGPYQMIPKEAYYMPPPSDTTMSYSLKLSSTLRNYFNIPVEVFHHEVARNQMEINFEHAEPITTSDRLVTIKYAARNVANVMNKVAIFIPKILPDDNGSGLHTHISLWNDETNAFFDPNDNYANLSQTARYFIGGLLEHARALAAITNPTINSYRRLIPGYEAPVYLVWSKSNRSAAVRIPYYHSGDNKASRIEYRPPDPTANPYLALSGIILAGLDGISKKIDPGDPIDKNIYHMSNEQRRQLGIQSLPRSLEEALDELESDMEWLTVAIPKELLESYIDLKRKEARALASYPSLMEIKTYINL